MPKVLAAMMKFSKKNSDVQIMPSITGQTVVSFDEKDPTTGQRVASIMLYVSDKESKELMKAYASADTSYVSNNSGKVFVSVCKNTEEGETKIFELIVPLNS